MVRAVAPVLPNQLVSFASLDCFDLTPLASPRFRSAPCPLQNLLMVFHPSLHLCQLDSLKFFLLLHPLMSTLCLTVSLFFWVNSLQTFTLFQQAVLQVALQINTSIVCNTGVRCMSVPICRPTPPSHAA